MQAFCDVTQNWFPEPVHEELLTYVLVHVLVSMCLIKLFIAEERHHQDIFCISINTNNQCKWSNSESYYHAYAILEPGVSVFLSRRENNLKLPSAHWLWLLRCCCLMTGYLLLHPSLMCCRFKMSSFWESIYITSRTTHIMGSQSTKSW